MAKTTKVAAWALALSGRLAASPASSKAKRPDSKEAAAAPTQAVKRAPKKPAKKPAKKPKRAPPGLLARVLTGAARLPETDPVRLACARRLSDLVTDADGDTSALADLLGVDRRSAQRLRVAYGIERRVVAGRWV